MTLPKVTLDGVELTAVPSAFCYLGETACYFDEQSIRQCEPRHCFCDGGTPETQVIFLDDAGLLKHLTARITG